MVHTEPESGTTNFSGDQFVLHFSEFVNRSTLKNSLSVKPDIGITYSLNWGRKKVAVEFDDPLPELTTVILSVGTELTDMNGNTIASPVKLAVSTGPEIDSGKLTGRVLDARTGKGNSGDRILLFRSSSGLSGNPNYSTQTDTSGMFTFLYLGQGKYRAIWVEDRNRNKQWDPDIERAQPFGREFVTLEKEDSDTLDVLYKARSDTSAPEIQGVGMFSSRRMRIRFSENISLTDNTRMEILDSLGNSYSEAYPLYVDIRDRYVLFGRSQKKLMESMQYRLNISQVEDEAGNTLSRDLFAFEGTAQNDTTAQRIIGRRDRGGLYPEDPVSVIYAKPISDSVIRDSLIVVEGRELIRKWTRLEIDRNRLLIHPDGSWKEGVEYEMRVWDPKLNTHFSVQPDIWHENELGSIRIEASDTLDRGRLLLSHDSRGIIADTAFSDTLEIDRLPPLSYKVRVFDDENGNGKWDPGSADPYRAPEPYYIQLDVPVRERFTSSVSIEF